MIIREQLNLSDIMQIQQLYRSCEYIDIFDDNHDIQVEKFRYFVIHILMLVININDGKEETRAIIISESIRDDIIDAYNRRDYRDIL